MRDVCEKGTTHGVYKAGRMGQERAAKTILCVYACVIIICGKLLCTLSTSLSLARSFFSNCMCTGVSLSLTACVYRIKDERIQCRE